MLNKNLFFNHTSDSKLINNQNAEKNEHYHKVYSNMLRLSFKIFLKKCEEALCLNAKIIEPERKDYQVK